MQNFRNRRSVQICAQNAGSNVLKSNFNDKIVEFIKNHPMGVWVSNGHQYNFFVGHAFN